VFSRPVTIAFRIGVLISGHFSEQEARNLVTRSPAGLKIEAAAN